MKRLVCFLLMFVAFSCRQSPVLTDEGLHHLESRLQENPDSVYAVLQTTDEHELPQPVLAFYYMLLTEAADKLYMEHTTDSLIAISRRYYESVGDNKRLAKAWYLTGRIHTDWEQWESAIADFLKAKELAGGSDDWALRGRIVEYLGEINWQNDLNEKALGYFKEAYHCYRQIPDSLSMAFALKGQGNVYWSLGNADSTFKVFHQALALIKPQDNWRLIVSLYRRMSFIYQKSKQYDASYDCICNAIRFSQEIPYTEYEQLGGLYLEMNKLDSAYYYLQQALQPGADLNTRCAANYDLADWAERVGKHTEALAYRKQYEILADSFYMKKQPEEVATIQHQFAQKEAEKTYLQKNNIQIICFALIILSFIVSFFVYRKRKRMELTELFYKQSEQMTTLVQTATQQVLQHEEQNEILKTQNQQQLQQMQGILIARCKENIKVKKIYQSGWELDRYYWDSALPEIEEIYGHTISCLKKTHPGMTETELSICILSLMKIKTKQIASLLELQPSTITSYKRDIKKKYFGGEGRRRLEECLLPYLG